MGYRWKPNASQRREFAERIKDPAEQAAYAERKRHNHSYAGFKDKSFIPTQQQYDYAMYLIGLGLESISYKVADAANMVTSAWVCQDKVHHDYIHIINSVQRGDKTPLCTEFN